MIIQLINFQGDLTDISVLTAMLTVIPESPCRVCVRYGKATWQHCFIGFPTPLSTSRCMKRALSSYLPGSHQKQKVARFRQRCVCCCCAAKRTTLSLRRTVNEYFSADISDISPQKLCCFISCKFHLDQSILCTPDTEADCVYFVLVPATTHLKR